MKISIKVHTSIISLQTLIMLPNNYLFLLCLDFISTLLYNKRLVLVRGISFCLLRSVIGVLKSFNKYNFTQHSCIYMHSFKSNAWIPTPYNNVATWRSHLLQHRHDYVSNEIPNWVSARYLQDFMLVCHKTVTRMSPKKYSKISPLNILENIQMF